MGKVQNEQELAYAIFRLKRALHCLQSDVNGAKEEVNFIFTLRPHEKIKCVMEHVSLLNGLKETLEIGNENADWKEGGR